MKIRFERKCLLSKLRLAKNAIDPKGYNPIFQNVKIVADKRYGAILHAMDAEHGIRIRVDCEVVDNGAVLLPIKEIINILSQSKQDRFWLEIRNDKIVIWGEECGQWEFTMQHPDNLPDIAEFSAESYHKIPKEELQRMIRHTIFAIDKTNERFSFTGVCFECRMANDSPLEDVITAVTTDGRRLAVQTKYAERIGNPKIESEIVYRNGLKLVEKILKDKTCSEDVKMAFNDNRVVFQYGDITIFSQLLQGRFPKWENLIPEKDLMHKAKINRNEFLQALITTKSALSNFEPMVDLIFNNGTLTLEGFNGKDSKSKVSLPVSCFVNGRIRFDPKFLIDVSKALDSELELYVYLPDDNSNNVAMMIKTNDGYCYLLMPMSVSHLKNKDDYSFPSVSESQAEEECKKSEIESKYASDVESKEDENRESEYDDDWDDVVYHDVLMSETPAIVDTDIKYDNDDTKSYIAQDVQKWVNDKIIIGTVGFENDIEQKQVVTGIKDAIVNHIIGEEHDETLPADTKYIPTIQSALCEMIQHSAIPDVLDGSILASVQREDGQAVSGAILQSHKRGKIVFMEWKTGFVYHIPARSCKKSNGQGFTILSITDNELSKNMHLLNMFTAKSLF